MASGLRKGLKTFILAVAVVGFLSAGVLIAHWAKSGTTGVSPDTHEVIRVVDGDTIVVAMTEGTEKIRLIGINTPETVDPRKKVECFGKEASRRTNELVAGKIVRLETDPHAGERDKYGRLLGYVYLEDGTLVNEVLIREGYAHENGYGRAYAKRERFREAEREAREARRGLWDPSVCGQQDDPAPRTPQKKK